MSANINFTREGIASYVENGKKERAWHGLGKVYDRPITVVEAIEGCNANFEVGLQPVIAATPQLETLINGGAAIDSDSTRIINGKQFVSVDMLKDLIIDGRKATMRYDYNQPLAVVSDQYGVVQYRKAFEFVDLITTGKLGGDVPTIECAGLLGKNGERLFITAKFPEPIIVSGKDDVIDQYLIFTTSHDGSSAVTCLCSNVRVVCNNTLNLALRNNSGRITFKHTSRVNERMDLLNKENADMAYRTLGLYNTYKAHFEAELEHLRNIRLSDKDCERILAEVLLPEESFDVYKLNDYNINSEDISTRSKNLFYNALNALHTGIGQQDNKELEGTGLYLINGLTTLYQNSIDWKDKEKKFLSITEGNVFNKVQKAHQLVLDYEVA